MSAVLRPPQVNGVVKLGGECCQRQICSAECDWCGARAGQHHRVGCPNEVPFFASKYNERCPATPERGGVGGGGGGGGGVTVVEQAAAHAVSVFPDDPEMRFAIHDADTLPEGLRKNRKALAEMKWLRLELEHTRGKHLEKIAGLRRELELANKKRDLASAESGSVLRFLLDSHDELLRFVAGIVLDDHPLREQRERSELVIRGVRARKPLGAK